MVVELDPVIDDPFCLEPVSQLADRFVKDPHEVVKAGDVVRVRVTEVDIPRKRIGLSMRKDGGAEATQPKAAAQPKPAKDKQANVAAKPATSSQGALGSALAAALRGQGDR